MPRGRINYQVLDVLVGPAPASGFYFVNYTGTYNNDFNNLVTNHNLIKEISRVQNFDYGFRADRNDVKQVGKKGLVSRPVLNSPVVEFSFEYLIQSVRNEARMGMNVNYGKLEYPFRGEPFYDDNFSVFLLSGLTTKKLNRPNTDPFWPNDYRDCRNFHVVVALEGADARTSRPNNQYRSINPVSNTYQVISFGNCYLNSYGVTVNVGQFPKANATWIGENVTFNTSGSGINTPAVNKRTRLPLTGIKLVVPETSEEGGPSSLLPADFRLEINNLNGTNLFGADLADAKIDRFSFEIDFNREPLNSLGYKLPLDREINFPVICDLTLDMTAGDYASGSLSRLLEIDSEYNIQGIFSNPECYKNPAKFKTYAAAQISGTANQYLRTAYDDRFNPGSGDFTVAAWVLLNGNASPMGIVSKEINSTNQREWSLFYDNASSAFRLSVSPDGISEATVANATSAVTGQWYYVLGYYDVATQNLFIKVNDNSPASGSNIGSNIFKGNAPVVIGAEDNGGTNLFNGRVDEVAFWRRKLTNNEMTYLYNGGMAQPYYKLGLAGTDGVNLKSGLMAHWGLDEFTGRRFDSVHYHHMDPQAPQVAYNSGIIPNPPLPSNSVRYDFRKAKFIGVSYSSAIGSNKRVSLNFQTDLDPEDSSKGLFISGLLNLDKTHCCLLNQHSSGLASGDKSRLAGADNSKIIVHKMPLY